MAGLLAAPAAAALAQVATHPPFEGFTSAACAIAPQWIDQLASRDTPDTAVHTPAKDTTSRLAADSVRLCIDAVRGAAEEEWQLLNFARVQLIVGDDDRARSATAAYLATLIGAPVERRAWALYLSARDHATARPARFPALREALQGLDRLGRPAARLRVLAHLAYARAAQVHFEDDTVVAAANAVTLAWRELGEPERLQTAFELAVAHTMKAEIALRRGLPAMAQAIIDSADALVPQEARQARNVVDAHKAMYALVGQRAPSLETAYWFAASEDDSLGIPRPRAGRVTLISTATHACRIACRSRYNGLRRLAQRFSGDLDLIHSTKTLGFMTDSAPAPPAAEASFDSTYFLGKQRLPGVLAVAETEYYWLPDGRRMNRPTTQERNYPHASVVIVDGRGVVRYASTSWNPVLEVPIARFIETLLAESNQLSGQRSGR